MEDGVQLQAGEKACSATNKPKLNSQNLQMVYFNAQGMSNKFTEFQDLLYSDEFDIVAVTETWFNSSVSSSEFTVKGYTCFRQDRRVDIFEDKLFVNDAKGGVILLIKNFLNPELVTVNVETEMVTYLIQPQDLDPLYILCCIYRPESAGVSYLQRVCQFLMDLVTIM